MWIIPAFIYIIFIIPCARAQNIQTLLICRFLCGFFASAPLTLAGGTISDVWDNEERGFAIALFAAAPYGGPVLGPLIGGFVGETVGWRWMFWVCPYLPSSVLKRVLMLHFKGQYDLRWSHVRFPNYSSGDICARSFEEESSSA